jgi:lipopolysaccharide/colanic/teichoic acid biosynthesis glycosyltransferase
VTVPAAAEPVRADTPPLLASVAPVGWPSLVAKRTMDVVLAAIAIVVLCPVLLAIAALVAIDSGRPVLYAGERVGSRPRRQNGRIEWEVRSFRMRKFRTMRADAAASPLHRDFVRAFVAGQIPPGVGNGVLFKLADDPRLTRVGHWLRATSLDEVPQLFNVLLGTMSLVGPRPVPPYEVAAYEDRHMLRLAAMPGMTGIWQVHGRGRTSFEEMVQMDVDYVRRRSLRLDVWLVLCTIPQVLLRRGAK